MARGVQRPVWTWVGIRGTHDDRPLLKSGITQKPYRNYPLEIRTSKRL